MYEAGECPGSGIYICMVCSEKVIVENDEDTLPLCPKCKGSMYS